MRIGNIFSFEVAHDGTDGKGGLESVMMDTMYELPSDDTVGECIITEQTVEGTEKPQIVRRDIEVVKREERARRFLNKSGETA